jgi:hypothetical protein
VHAVDPFIERSLRLVARACVWRGERLLLRFDGVSDYVALPRSRTACRPARIVS